MPTKVLFSFLLTAILLLAAAPAQGADDAKLVKLFEAANEILEELHSYVPAPGLAKADCISVLNMGKGGFIFGGTGGGGVLTCRDDEGDWSAPVLLKVGGGTVGAQIGGQRVRLVMVFYNVERSEDLAHATPLFQGSASATAGPSGIGMAVGGNPSIGADIVTVSKSSGLYAGATWEGMAIDPDEKRIEQLYGEQIEVAKLMGMSSSKAPELAKEFMASVDKLGEHKGTGKTRDGAWDDESWGDKVDSSEDTLTAITGADDPEAAMLMIFDAAKEGHYKALKDLCKEGTDNDGDVRKICAIAEAPPDEQSDFQQFFAKGSIVGKAVIKGDGASVNFLFGPKGAKKETMNLIRVDGRWYLASF